jgi:hypothetical protein
MTVESAADRLAMLNDFGIDAIYTPVGGGAASTVKGIFDNEHMVAEGDPASAATRMPRFQCREADLTLNGKEGDALVIGSIAYHVKSEPVSDGAGMTTLWLEKQ